MGAEVPGGLAELVERVIRDSGLEKMYQAQANAGKSEGDAERLDNLAELVSSARQFEQEYAPDDDPAQFPGIDEARAGAAAGVPPLLSMLRAYLESVSLVADADAVDPAQGAVTLMTLHAAKGLEFPAVAIIGLEEGVLPHSRGNESEAELEEERRLAFVGITRAMRHLMMTSAKYRTIRGRSERSVPSRFIEEIQPAGVQVSDQSDPFGELPERWSRTAARSDIDDYDAVDPPHDADEALTSIERARGETASARARVMYPVGCRVRHPQFGTGTVTQVMPGPSPRVRVSFRDVGEKTLVIEYARLTRVG